MPKIASNSFGLTMLEGKILNHEAIMNEIPEFIAYTRSQHAFMLLLLSLGVGVVAGGFCLLMIVLDVK